MKILIKKSRKNELFLMSSALTYRLIISIFPFIIFIITLLGFFDFNSKFFTQDLLKIIPEDAYKILDLFTQEIFLSKRISLLSSSFVLSTYSASTGFYFTIKVLNKAYNKKEDRGAVKVRIISILLVFIFAFLISFSLLLLVFGDVIKNFVLKYTVFKLFANLLESLFFYLFLSIMLLTSILIVFKISVNKKLSLTSVLPGSIFTTLGWIIFSKIFNIYINNFSKYSIIYGSIGSVLIFFIWMNIIAYLFLLGGQINAILIDLKEG